MYVKVIIKLQMIVNLFLETNEKDKKKSIMDYSKFRIKLNIIYNANVTYILL